MRHIISRFTVGIFILIVLVEQSFAACNGLFTFGCESTPPYCNSEGECTIQQGVDDTGTAVDDLVTDRPISEYAQDIVVYLLAFISIIAVIYIIYAGFQVLIGAGDEEKMKKAKNIIVYVIIGIVLMWLSYSIVSWIMGVLETSGTSQPIM